MNTLREQPSAMRAQVIGGVVRPINSTFTQAVVDAQPQVGIAAGVLDAIINFLGGGPSRWDAAGPGVHDWFHYGPDGTQDFQDWLDTNAPQAFGSLDAVFALAPAFLKQKWNVVIWPGGPYGDFYKQGPTEMGYEAIGIDYPTTLDESTQGQQPVWIPLLNPVRPAGNGSGAQAGGRPGAGSDAGADEGGDTPAASDKTLLYLGAAAAALFLLPRLTR